MVMGQNMGHRARPCALAGLLFGHGKTSHGLALLLLLTAMSPTAKFLYASGNVGGSGAGVGGIGRGIGRNSSAMAAMERKFKWALHEACRKIEKNKILEAKQEERERILEGIRQSQLCDGFGSTLQVRVRVRKRVRRCA